VEHQAEIRTRLALTLKVVVSQTLLRRRDGMGRVCGREIMFVNAPISNLIREAKIHQINNAIGTHYAEGMMLLDDALLGLYEKDLVEYVDVVTRIQDPEKLRSVRRKERGGTR
jgi:twitching motility protein PilT